MPKVLTEAELVAKRAKDAARKAAKRAADKLAKTQAVIDAAETIFEMKGGAYHWASTDEVKEQRARTILEEVGLQNQQVISTVYALSVVAARHHKIPVNEHLLRYGLAQTLAAKTGARPVEFEDDEVEGELSTLRELRYIFDLSIAWREPTLTFDQFLELRHICKSDAYRFGKEILGRVYEENPHGIWRDFFPKFNPKGLRRGYTQETFKKWLREQDAQKDFLLVASRNSFKSDFAIRWAASAICCAPDIKVLFVTETQALARKFMDRGVRPIFELKDPRYPTRFQQLMPEFCIDPKSGNKMEFDCPMATLDLIEHTIEPTSMESGSAGRRAHIIHFDDPISDETTKNAERIQSSIDKHSSFMKLVEPGGYTTMCATPWATNDLTAALIAQSNEDPEHPLRYRIDPAWVIKPDAKKRQLVELTPEDIESYLFPARLDFKFLMKDLKADKKKSKVGFRTQYMCEYLDYNAPEEEEKPLHHFDPDLLAAAIVNRALVPENGVLMLHADTAYTTNKQSDFSSITASKRTVNLEGVHKIFILETIFGKWRTSQLADNIVKQLIKYDTARLKIEEPPNSDGLKKDIWEHQVKYGQEVMSRIHWVKDNTKQAKANRITSVEGLLNRGAIKFVNNGWDIESIFAQFAKVERTRPDSKGDWRIRQCDGVDTIAMACAELPVSRMPDVEETPESAAERDRAERIARMKDGHRQMFGDSSPLFHSTASTFGQPDAQPEPPRQTDSRMRDLTTRMGIKLPAGFRL